MKKVKSTRLYVTMGFMLLFTALFLFQGKTAYAASKITINEVDYENENIKINNNSNTKIKFALERDAAKGIWEEIDVDSPDTTEIDFSWLSSSSDNTLIFKGDQDDTEVRVKILGRAKKLEVSISYADIAILKSSDTIAPLLNIMTSAGTADDPIVFGDLEWKKGNEGKWKNVSLLTVTKLEKYQIMGTELYFRINAQNDDATDVAEDTVNHPYPNGTRGRRVSSPVRLRIAKKAAAATVGIDGSKLTANVGYGKEYRVIINSITPNSWTKVMDRKSSRSLEEIVNDGSDGLSDSFPKMVIEIRDYATSTKAASKITRIALDAQRLLQGTIKDTPMPATPTAAELKNIYVSYNGISNIIVTIPNASTSLQYEYYIQKPGTIFNLQATIWTAITRDTGVKILADRAVDGGILHIRKKMIRTSSEFELASTEDKYIISYPSVPEITKQTLLFTKGVSGDLTFDAIINKANKPAFETKIKSIKLGTRELGFSYTISPDLTDPFDFTVVHTMTVKLLKDSLESMTNCYAKPLYITYENGTVDRISLKITIQNPTPAASLLATASAGTATGATSVKVSSYISTGNKLVYTKDAAEVKGKYTTDKVTSGTDFVAGADITVPLNSYITVYEVNANNYIVKIKSILIDSGKIKQ